MHAVRSQRWWYTPENRPYLSCSAQWRRPRGTNKLLCNACGIYFTRYGKLPEQRPHQVLF